MTVTAFVVAAAIIGVAAFLTGFVAGRVMSVSAAVIEAEERRESAARAATRDVRQQAIRGELKRPPEGHHPDPENLP